MKAADLHIRERDDGLLVCDDQEAVLRIVGLHDELVATLNAVTEELEVAASVAFVMPPLRIVGKIQRARDALAKAGA